MPPQLGDLSINGACATQSCVMIHPLEAPGNADLVHPYVISPLLIERALEDKIT